MKIFLSWSGGVSHKIAEKLHKWLPMVIQKIDPYISSEIEKGTRWSSDIARELEQCSFGIACVTAENKDAPWLLFEAGALSKSVAEGKLAPVLFGLQQGDIQKSPLTQFQMTKFERTEFFKLLTSINEAIENRLDGDILSNLFDALWPKLDSEVSEILISAKDKNALEPAVDPQRVLGAMEELLTNSRAIIQAISRPERLLPEDYVENILRRADRHSTRSPNSNRRLDMLAMGAYDDIRQAVDNAEGDIKETLVNALAKIKELRFYIRRDRDIKVGSIGRPRHSSEVIQRVRNYKLANPDASIGDIANFLGIKLGRVAEIVEEQQ